MEEREQATLKVLAWFSSSHDLTRAMVRASRVGRSGSELAAGLRETSPKVEARKPPTLRAFSRLMGCSLCTRKRPCTESTLRPGCWETFCLRLARSRARKRLLLPRLRKISP